MIPEREMQVDGDILSVTAPEGWAGRDRLRIDMTHDTGELTVRYLFMQRVTPEMNFPEWTQPNPEDFDYVTQIIGTFDEASGVTLEHGPMVGAFIDGNLAGVSTAREVDGKVLLMINVYSNDPEAEIGMDHG